MYMLLQNSRRYGKDAYYFPNENYQIIIMSIIFTKKKIWIKDIKNVLTNNCATARKR